MNKLGSPNWWFQGINCGSGMFTVMPAIAGWGYLSYVAPGLTKSSILWGFNPPASQPTVWNSFLEARKQGTKLIVIDPKLTEAASAADLWLQPRPGTDGALAMGMINVIINEDLYDHDFVDQWTIGFEDLKERVASYTPERVQEITWVPAEKMIQAARIYATEKPGSIIGHLSWIHLGGEAANAACIYTSLLPVITGNLDQLGGSELGFPAGENNLLLEEAMGWDELINNPRRKRDAIGSEIIPRGCDVIKKFEGPIKRVHPSGYTLNPYLLFPPLRAVWDGILTEKPYPIKALLVQASNPLSCNPNANRVLEALTSDNLDLLVVMDVFMTPTAMLADYVLPAADWIERPELFDLFVAGAMYEAGEQACQPLYERHQDYDLWRDLGNRLGQQGEWSDTIEGEFDKMLEPWGFGFEEYLEKVSWSIPEPRPLKHLEPGPDGKPIGFGTPSGKVEIKASLLADLGFDPLPDYQEPPWSPVSTPDLAEEYPLILTTGSRIRYFTHSELRQIPALRHMHPWPEFDIHPETARKYGLANGDWAYIETPMGKICQKVHIFEGILPGVIHSEAYWWFPERRGEAPYLFDVLRSNANVLTPDDYDTCNLGADNYLRGLLCRIYKAKAPEGLEGGLL